MPPSNAVSESDCEETEHIVTRQCLGMLRTGLYVYVKASFLPWSILKMCSFSFSNFFVFGRISKKRGIAPVNTLSRANYNNNKSNSLRKL